MPTVVTVHLHTADPLFFDETWSLERPFRQLLASARPSPSPAEGQHDAFQPYTLSPLWRVHRRQRPNPGRAALTAYRWRICLLDDALAPPLLAGLQAMETLTLQDASLTVEEVTVETQGYPQLVRQAQEQVGDRPESARRLSLEFITPTVLRRSGLPMPLPDPLLVFRHYLLCWDTFAPPEFRVNLNLLDAIAFHVALTEHRLETRRVRPEGKPPRIGFLGSATYTVMAWEKLGPGFLEMLHTLARFGTFCGTGEMTAQGLGQTRYGAPGEPRKPRRSP
ncbi:MAG: CRISPR system precrRNA processing endoribonuclease RAMP protein Cas6 [Chloroflexi bacterium]|nr:MAG: CRISPR system precrRNA processing endoribonuclease RAMP protein Cas6 [Chloroflexota bacterium]